jgi:hypothetical protein
VSLIIAQTPRVFGCIFPNMRRKRLEKDYSVGAVLVWIDDQRRIDVDREPVSAALNLKINAGETVRVWALSGSENQLQLLPPQSELSKLRSHLEGGAAKKDISWEAGGDLDVATYRQLVGFFNVACHARKSGNTVRLTLPSAVVDLGYFKPREPLILFCTGELVELWPQDRWRQIIANRDLRDLTRRARRALRQ